MNELEPSAPPVEIVDSEIALVQREALPAGFDMDTVQLIVDDLKRRGGQDEVYGYYLRDAFNDLIQREAGGRMARRSLKALVLLVDELEAKKGGK
jgi:hypothetical protein